jgi:type I site-specific restriction endonuclease
MKVVVSGNVWLPIDDLSAQQILNIKELLTIYPKKTTDIATKADPKPIYMYDEKEDFIGVPRAWYRKNVTKEHDEILKISYGSKMSAFTTRYQATGNFIEQEAVIRTFLARMEGKKWDGFLLKAGCAFGKTACSLEFARRVGRKTLIIVHKEFFLKQWKNRIKKFMPDAKVGIIRQNKCEFEDCDFVIAMLQSLVRDKDSHKYPERIYKSEFGIIISDECHRIAASSWSSVLPRFNAAWRVGLTATPRRKDGAQDVFFNHISDVTYSAKTKAQVPGLRVLKTYSCLKPIRRGNYYVSVDNLNSAQILTQLGKDQFRAKDIVDQLVLAVQNGRKIIVVSERLHHLKLMSDMLMNSLFDLDLPFEPTIDFCTGEWFSGEVWEESNSRHKKGDPKMVKRTEADFDKAERANVIFATKQSIEEGFDVEALDVLVLSMPMGDIEQIVGRARRWCYQDKEKCEHYCPWRVGNCKEKPKPIIVDVVDENIPQLLPKWRRRQKFYRKIGTEVS